VIEERQPRRKLLYLFSGGKETREGREVGTEGPGDYSAGIVEYAKKRRLDQDRAVIRNGNRSDWALKPRARQYGKDGVSAEGRDNPSAQRAGGEKKGSSIFGLETAGRRRGRQRERFLRKNRSH